VKVLLVDAYDSFSPIIDQYLLTLGADTEVVRSRTRTTDQLVASGPDAVVLGPGPGHPADSGHIELVHAFAGRVPLLGVCLGHQAIGLAYGAKIAVAEHLMHGKTSRAEHDGQGVFAGAVTPLTVTRYHSLIVTEPPPELAVTATSLDDGYVMGVLAARRLKWPPGIAGNWPHPVPRPLPTVGRVISGPRIADHDPRTRRTPCMDSVPAGASTLTVTIDERVSERVPGYVLGLIAVPDIEVVKDTPLVGELLTAAEDELHGAGLSKADVSALPTIAAWREAYRAVGVNPSRFPCAAESVLRRVAKGDRLPRINSLVDLCNAVSLATRLPVASCDVGDIDAELSVRLADGSETCLPLGTPDAPEHPEPGEVVYADGQGRAHSRRWNWRQSDVVKTGLGPRRLLITVESAHEGGRDAVEEALGRITGALAGLTAELGRPLVLDRAKPLGRLFTARPAATVR
jgi:anthranilate synthase/aminodeoxychorismate synthase-like glutamine amidotransferase